MLFNELWIKGRVTVTRSKNSHFTHGSLYLLLHLIVTTVATHALIIYRIGGYPSHLQGQHLKYSPATEQKLHPYLTRAYRILVDYCLVLDTFKIKFFTYK